MIKKITSVLTILCMMTAMVLSVNVLGTTEVKASPKAGLFSGAMGYSAFNMKELALSVEEDVNYATAAKSVEEPVADVVDDTFCGYKNIGVCIVDEGNLNVRETPDPVGTVVGKMPVNAGCEVLEILDGWTKISSGKIEGYVKSEYLLTGAAALAKAKELAVLSAVPTEDYLRVRAGAGTNYAVLDQLMEGESLECLEKLDNGWVKVDFDGHDGYVSGDYVKVMLTLPTAMTLAQARYGAEISDVRVKLCEFALQYIGRPYVWGGESLTNGVDCSGYVMKIYQAYGIYLPHYSGAQANCGVRINASELQPGDLCFYSSGGAINHVGIYIGGGQIVHAANERDGIKISSAYYRYPAACVRILN